MGRRCGVRGERANVSARGPVITQHPVAAEARHIEVSVRPEGQARRLVEPAAARVDEGIHERPGGPVVAEDAVVEPARDVQVPVAADRNAGRAVHLAVANTSMDAPVTPS